MSGRRIRLNYMTQPKARPPSFVLFCSRADAVPQSYLRYLVNSLREAFETVFRTVFVGIMTAQGRRTYEQSQKIRGH